MRDLGKRKPISKGQPTHIPDAKYLDVKPKIIEYLNSFPSVYRSYGPIRDEIAGTETGAVQLYAYTDGVWGWDSFDLYYLSKYNLPLQDEFLTMFM